MFTSKKNAKALIFEFKSKSREPIHSFFGFFPFVVIWLDKSNKIIDLELVKPFRFFIRPKKSFSKLVEIPVNKKYMKIVKLLVGD